MTQPSSPSQISTARAAILERLGDAAKLGHHPQDDVTLVAVSKKQPDDRIEAMLATGQRVFGENRVQEAQGRWAARRERFPDLELRLIGALQTNKAEDAVALFDVIETLDREKLARHLAKAMEKLGRHPSLFVQVNTGQEDQKAGISPRDTAAFVRRCGETYGLSVEGLMCIPPVDEPASLHFALLAKLAKEAGLKKLSMGMSADFELAARMGATSVRVGSALFGARPDPA